MRPGDDTSGMVFINGFHHSGRWDRPSSALARSIHRTRQHASYGTRTEMGTKAQDVVLKSWDDWGVYHPITKYGYVDCSIEWDKSEWDLVDRGIIGGSVIRIHTSKGFLLPPPFLVWARLRHLDRGQVVDVSTMHMALMNTALRRKQWREEAAAARQHFRTASQRGDSVVYQADLNRNQRLAPFRYKVSRELMRDTGMRNLWVGNLPAVGGTHGRSLLDATLSTMHGKSYLLRDDDSSDHRPYGTTLLLPRR